MSMSRRLLGALPALFAVFLPTACGDVTNDPDAGPAADAGPATDAGPAADAGPDSDAGPGTDGGTGSVVTTCPGASRPPLAGSAVCEATPGDAALLITADILTPEGVLAGGQVLVDATGTIACVGCDCASAAGAAAATRLDCPDGVVSPGLINAHEHMTFQGRPYTRTDERYEHRHDWRRGLHGHTRIGSRMGTREEMVWAEIRMVMSGATSINGSGGPDGFLRNLDRSNNGALMQPSVEYDTFPLDDSNGTQATSGCSYGMTPTTASQIARNDSYTPHIAEGIDGSAQNEFACTSSTDGGGNDVIGAQTAVIHAVALAPADIAAMAADNAMLIWSPRSNVTLYGDTARVTEYDRLGVPIALGTDWVFTGSMNMVRELQCADALNADYMGGHFSDEDLWRMATLNGAIATATDDAVGAITVGRIADLAVYDGRVHPLHRAVIDAEPADVALVLRSGVPLFGEASTVPALRDGAACDTLDVCGASRRVCVSRETGMTLAALQSAITDPYPLFFCGEPEGEPSCVPARVASTASVMGSTVYSGIRSAGDSDGDGLPNAEDLCPSVFSPIRPMDQGAQPDADADGIGDACDACPLEAGTATCAPADPGDRDRDMVPDASDNCPTTPNMGQEDADGDGKGDACDPCPADPNPGAAACPASIYDVKTGRVAVGSVTRVVGVVTATGANGLFLQVTADDPDFAGEDNSGVFVYTRTAPTQARGDRVAAEGMVSTFQGQIQITASMLAPLGTTAVPAPVVATPATVATGGARASALDGVLVRVESVTVATTGASFGVEGGLTIGNFLFTLAPAAGVGEAFTSITGVLGTRTGWGGSNLMARDAADFVAGSVRLAALGPSISFARVGRSSAPTFPAPLTVQLSRAASTDTLVTVRSSGPEATVSNVTVPAGAASAVVPVTAMTASGMPVTITATLGADVRTAEVRTLGATEAPRAFTLSPGTARVFTSAAATFTLALDVPAPAGGVSFGLADTTGSRVPATVSIPEDALEVRFDLIGGPMPATGTLTASASFGTPQSAAITVASGLPGRVVINEVDYDQPGAGDSAEFIELMNPGVDSVDLTGMVLVLVNGSGGAEYGRVALSGALAPGGYLVIGIAGQMLTLPTGARRLDFPATVTAIQNGSPDGIALLDASGTLLDAVCYEGAMTSASIGGRVYSLVEGTATTATDLGSGSLVRAPNGSDTDDASVDWSLSTTPTPGASNAAGM